ncbi:MAG: sensor histidine kinase [Pyrinomonadaceae bacterium]|nr:sensor histidine kinase [Pyrinomonadaceae bacterium]
MRNKRHSAKLQAAGIAIVILSVTALHLITPLDRITLHEIYQRLYYIPIIAAAVLFGMRGGFGAALFASLAYIPHISLHWQHRNFDYSLNQYAEIILFNVIGIVTGVLSDRSRRARARTERTAEELQKAYAELRQTFEQLLQAERLTSLGELSAAVVHEVRNPLGSIKGAVEILEDALPPDNPRREFADIAKREVERLDRLVGEFLHFARPPKPAVAPADVNEIVRSVATLTEQRAATQNVRVELSLAPDLPLLMIDAEQIKQVLLNLTINALQAMPGGGRIMLRTFSANGDGVAIEVEDEGGGVDTAIALRIFDPFFTTKEKGVGLGLSIAYKIAAQHGGSLSVSNSERGATFKLQFPSTPPQSARH